MSGVRSLHGTRSRYLAGCRCDPCRDANSAYIAEWRRTCPPEVRQREKANERLYDQAKRILARRHPAEYRAILADLRAEQVAS